LTTANWLSILTFAWITPTLDLGYARTLQATDLNKVDKSRSAEFLSTGLEEAWKKRVEIANTYNKRLENGEVKPSFARQGVWWCKRRWRNVRRCNEKMTKEDQEASWKKAKRKRASLAWALNDIIGRRFWIAGVYKVSLFLFSLVMRRPLLVF